MAQGLGDGPAQVLAGTGNGYICLLEHADQPHPVRWTLGNQLYSSVNCLAANDDVVVAGYRNGHVRVLRMNPPPP
jgi:hypothetical protein